MNWGVNEETEKFKLFQKCGFEGERKGKGCGGAAV